MEWLTHVPLVPHICVNKLVSFGQYMYIVCRLFVVKPLLNHCSIIFNRTKYIFFIHKNSSGNIVCEIEAILTGWELGAGWGVVVWVIWYCTFCDDYQSQNITRYNISNHFWRHQQNRSIASETRGRCVIIVVFNVIYGFVMSCEK